MLNDTARLYLSRDRFRAVSMERRQGQHKRRQSRLARKQGDGAWGAVAIIAPGRRALECQLVDVVKESML